LTWRTSM